MRVLYASERPPYPFFLGGAARCAHRLLLALSQDLGATCTAVGSTDYSVTAWSYPQPSDYAALGINSVSPSGTDIQTDTARPVLDCLYPIRLLEPFQSSLLLMLKDFRPDVVWSQLEGAYNVMALARAEGIVGLLYVHDAEDDPNSLRATADLGCHVVCSSAFLARKVAKIIGRKAHVIYPASDWYFGTAGDASGVVTMINPHAVKGLDTFLEVARCMPMQRFLLVESWKLDDAAQAALQKRLAFLPNVRFQHRVTDMRTIYSQTRLLLVPSVWEEGFGMVAVEAQSCGIPVIASARGGLPESVGDGGLLIDDYRNVTQWLSAIDEVLRDDQAYRSWSVRALQHAQSAAFAPQEMARHFLTVCAAPPPKVGAYMRGRRALAEALSQLAKIGGKMQGGIR